MPVSTFNPLRKVGRNDPCPCGSGRKFKKCCLGKSVPTPVAETAAWISDPAGSEITEYDPMIEPDAAEWLALDEGERIALVKDYHRKARIRVPNATVHAIIHAVVENQIAMGDELPVKRTAQRMMAEGLDRHDAIHAIGFVLAVHLNDLMHDTKSQLAKRDAGYDPNAPYYAELEKLTAEAWRRSG